MCIRDSLDTDKKVVSTVSIDPASDDDIENTVMEVANDLDLVFIQECSRS